MKGDKNIKTSYFLKLLYLTIAAGIIFTLIDVILETSDPKAFITDLSFVIASLLSLSLIKWLKKIELSALLYFNTVLASITYQAINYDALFNPYFPLTIVTIGFLSPVLLKKYYLMIQHVFTVSTLVYVTIHHLYFSPSISHQIVADTPINFGLAYLVVYIVISLISYFLNKQYETAKNLAQDLARDLQGKNKEIKTQNEELLQRQESLNELNQYLEIKIEQRTSQIKQQNEKFIKYAFDNAHKVRGPLARILGLFYIRQLNKNEMSDEDIFTKIQYEIEQIDRITKQISRELELLPNSEDKIK